MQRDSYANGVPNWVDLGVPDPAKAADFYGGLFGWRAEEGPPEAGGYRVAELHGAAVAGIGPQQNPGQPFWTTYLKVDDVDSTVVRIRGAGGQLLAGPMDVMSQGRMAICTDPTGAVFGLWQPNSFAGAGIVNEPGALTWNELITTDVNAALAFYRDVFGLDAQQSAGDTGGVAYVEFQVGGESIAGMMPKPPDMPAEIPSFWNPYFAVADVDEALARATELGARVIVPKMTVDVGVFASLLDPQGAAFSIIAMTPGADSTAGQQ
jgi:predicted enzyme related to lactoylglutathione lyase